MPSTSILHRLGRYSAGHPWRILGAWLLIVAVAVALNATLLGSALTTEGRLTNEPESSRAETLLHDRLRGDSPMTELVLVRSDRYTVDDRAFQAKVEEIFASVTALGPEVIEDGFTYLQVPDSSLVSEDRRATLMPFVMAGNLDTVSANVGEMLEIVRSLDGADGFEVLQAGTASVGEDFGRIAEHDALTGEMVGIGVALVILAIVFGTVTAAGLPIVMAVVAIVVALGTCAVIGQFYELTFTVTNLITMMGLAVGIDYSLFMVSRYREERGKGYDRLDAAGRATATAGRTVLFSGMTVIVALAGMMIMPSSIFRSISAGSMLVVAIAVAAALTLLPGLLGLLGDRIESLRIPFLTRRGEGRARTTTVSRGHGFWDRVTYGVMKRPVVSVLLTVVPLLVASAFYLQISTGSAGVSSLPDRMETKQSFLALEEEFSAGSLYPVSVVIDGDLGSPAVMGAVERLQQGMAESGDFAGPAMPQVNSAGDLMALSIPLSMDPNSEEAMQAIERLRGDTIPAAFADVDAEVLVGGVTALNADFVDIVGHYTPIVFAFVLGLSFVLLMMVFRSIVVPLKAILMNMLSVGAAYGLLVLVFQKGVGADLLGFQRADAIEAWLPLFLFSILFGLSMDYHVLLLSRIRERYDETGDNADSVAFGLRNTAGLITGAAVIMVAVFGGFAGGDLLMFQQMGFGLAVAVLIDATIVRSVLVPASMKLLGSANWWLPRPLHWLPDLRVEVPATRTPALDRRADRILSVPAVEGGGRQAA